MNRQLIVITGGVGYIGSYVTRALLSAGYLVVIIDDLSTGKTQNLPDGVHFFEGDFTEQKIWQEVMQLGEVECVIHLASKINAIESLSQKELYYREIVTKTKDLLSILARNKIQNIIYSSSAAVYGDAKILPTPENALLAPLNPYGEYKARAEKLIEDFVTSTLGKAVIFRYFNVCGGLPEVGVLPSIEDALLTKLRHAVLDHNDFTIFGKNYSTKDGTCQRDLIHVADISHAHLLALQNWERLAGFELINLGSGQSYSILEIVNTANQLFNNQIKIKIGNPRPGEIVTSVADISKAKRLISYQPIHSTLQNILQTSLV